MDVNEIVVGGEYMVTMTVPGNYYRCRVTAIEKFSFAINIVLLYTIAAPNVDTSVHFDGREYCVTKDCLFPLPTQ